MRKITLFSKYLVFAFCLFAGSSSFSASLIKGIELPVEDSYQRNQHWLNIGLGVGSAAGTMSGNYRLSEHQLLSARVLHAKQLFFDESVSTDVGLMYGLIAKSRYGYISGSAGVGVARQDKYAGGLYERANYLGTEKRMSVPVEFQLFFTPTPMLGVGLIEFGDINSEKSILGAAVNIQLN